MAPYLLYSLHFRTGGILRRYLILWPMQASHMNKNRNNITQKTAIVTKLSENIHLYSKMINMVRVQCFWFNTNAECRKSLNRHIRPTPPTVSFIIHSSGKGEYHSQAESKAFIIVGKSEKKHILPSPNQCWLFGPTCKQCVQQKLFRQPSDVFKSNTQMFTQPWDVFKLSKQYSGYHHMC